MVDCVETAHADYLLSHLEPQGTSRMESLGEYNPYMHSQYLPQDHFKEKIGTYV